MKKEFAKSFLIIALMFLFTFNLASAAGDVMFSGNAQEEHIHFEGGSYDENDPILGGLFHTRMEDFAEGISVDGTTIISGTGALTPTTGSFSSTLNADGATTLGSTLTVATNLTGTNGVISYTKSDTSSSSVVDLMSLYHTSTGSGGLDGIGTGISYYAEDSAGSNLEMCTTRTILDDVTEGSEEVSWQLACVADNASTTLVNWLDIDSGLVTTGGGLNVDADGSGSDVNFYTDTSGEEFLWDASENGLFLDGADGSNVLTVSDGNVSVTDDVIVSGSLKYNESIETVTADNTLTSAESGLVTYISTTGSTTTLPAVATAAGDVYRFVVGVAFDTNNFVIDSAEGDNIEGSLIVAGAVVDCDAVDQINFIVDGENLGDYVELRSNGTSWFITSSNALTSGKLTCTDPS